MALRNTEHGLRLWFLNPGQRQHESSSALSGYQKALSSVTEYEVEVHTTASYIPSMVHATKKRKLSTLNIDTVSAKNFRTEDLPLAYLTPWRA